MTEKIDKVAGRIAREEDTRIRFARRVTDFVGEITSEQGTLLRCTPNASHTNAIRELHNFGKFSFWIETGQTMLGGNEVKVWYHPGTQYKKGLAPVLEVWWQADIEKCQFNKLDFDQPWQREILKLIHRRKIIAAQVHRVATAPVKRALTKYEQEMRELHLAERERLLAKRLAKQQQV